jgi:hypothetical protein
MIGRCVIVTASRWGRDNIAPSAHEELNCVAGGDSGAKVAHTTSDLSHERAASARRGERERCQEARQGCASYLKDVASVRMQRPGTVDITHAFKPGTARRPDRRSLDTSDHCDGNRASEVSQQRVLQKCDSPDDVRQGKERLVTPAVQGSSPKQSDVNRHDEYRSVPQLQRSSLLMEHTHAGGHIPTAAAAETVGASAIPVANKAGGNLSAAAALRARLRGQSAPSESQPEVHVFPQVDCRVCVLLSCFAMLNIDCVCT